jgi:DnaJ-class molecular chaperone
MKCTTCDGDGLEGVGRYDIDGYEFARRCQTCKGTGVIPDRPEDRSDAPDASAGAEATPTCTAPGSRRR